MAWLVLALTVLGCGSDETVAPGSDDTTVRPPAPTARVFADFESAYNQRDLARYDQMLDNQFVFRLSDYDYHALAHPSHWGRAQEIEYTTNLFNPDYDGAFQCDSVFFDFQNPNGYITLYKFHPDSAPDETWYSTVFWYTYYFRFGPNLAFASPAGGRIKLTVRNAGTNKAPVWKFVDIHDYGPYPIPTTQTASMSELLLWSFGAAKSVYAPPPQ